MDLGAEEEDKHHENRENNRLLLPKSPQKLKLEVLKHSELAKKPSKLNNFLTKQQETVEFLANPTVFSSKFVTFLKYLPEIKRYFLIQDYYEISLLSQNRRNFLKLSCSHLKSAITSCEILNNSHVLFGHLSGNLTFYAVKPQFSALEYLQTLNIFRIFAITHINFHKASNLIVLASKDANRLLIYAYLPEKSAVVFRYLFQRSDYGLFRAMIFYENQFIKDFPYIIAASTRPNVHIFHINQREKHEFFKTKQPIVALEHLCPENLVLACCMRNHMYFFSVEKKELVFLLENETVSDNIFYMEVRSLGASDFWLKVLVGNYFLSEIRVEFWEKTKKISSFGLPQKMITKGKIEVKNNKEILQILYLNNQGSKANAGQFIITAGDDFFIRIYNLVDMKLVRTWQASNLPINSIVIVPTDQGLYLASGSYNNVIQIWDIFKGDVPVQSLNAHILDVNALLFIEKDENIKGSAKYLVSGSSDKTVILWIYDHNYLFRRIAQAKACETSVISLEYLKLGDKQQWIAVGSRDKNIKLYSLPKLQVLRELLGHKDSVKSLVAYYRPKEFLALYYNEKLQQNFLAQNIYVNNNHLVKSSETPNLELKKEEISNSFLSPDVEIFLISGSMDKTIKIWDIFSGICLYTLYGHQGYINSLIWLNDNDHLVSQMASASQDGTIKIWDMINLVCLDTFNVDFPRFSSGLCYIKEENLLIYTNYKGEVTLQRIRQNFNLLLEKNRLLWRCVGNISCLQGETVQFHEKCVIF